MNPKFVTTLEQHKRRKSLYNLKWGFPHHAAADPAWWKEQTDQDPYLYHKTTPDAAQHILQEGLYPYDEAENQSGTTYNQELTPRPGHVYLARQRKLDNIREDIKHPVTLRIDARQLKPHQLNADEDAFAYGSGALDIQDPNLLPDHVAWSRSLQRVLPKGEAENYDKQFPMAFGTVPRQDALAHFNNRPDQPPSWPSLGHWANDTLNHPEHTVGSFQREGTIAHQGRVPPSAIAVHEGDPNVYGRVTQSETELHIGLEIPQAVAHKIFNWANDQDWPENTELEDPSDYHVTLMYSPDGHHEHKGADWIDHLDSAHCKVLGIDSFPAGDKGYAYVLRLDAPEVKDRAISMQKKAEENGLTITHFPGGYKPHLTIGYGPEKGIKAIDSPDLEFDAGPSAVSPPREEPKTSAWHLHSASIQTYSEFLKTADNNPGHSQALDALSMANIGHNIHYRFEKAQMTAGEAVAYATRLLKLVGYQPDRLNIQAAIQTWMQLYPNDQIKPDIQDTSEVATTPTESYPTLSRTASMSDYAEMVPISELDHLREWDRRPGKDPQSAVDPAYWNELKDHIAKHGIGSPLSLEYNPRTGRGYLGEGNHRLQIAQELGQTHAPVYIYRSSKDDERMQPMHQPGAYSMLDNRGFSQFGQYMKPSDIGMPTAGPMTPNRKAEDDWYDKYASSRYPADAYDYSMTPDDTPIDHAPGWLSGSPLTSEEPSLWNLGYGSELQEPGGTTIPPEPGEPPFHTPGANERAALHTGEIPGDETLMGPLHLGVSNPNSGVNPSYIGHAKYDQYNTGTPNHVPVYIKPAGDFHANDMANERASFAITKAMGIPMPHTVIRPISRNNQTLAQVQEAITGGHNLSQEYEYTPENNYNPMPQFANHYPEDARRIALLDNVIGNGDRHLGNVVRGEDGDLYPIDHGGAFEEGTFAQGLGTHYRGQYLTPDEIQQLQQARGVDTTQMGIDHHSHEAMINRIDRMLETGRML
jgi:2'-5' RNA ligase